MSWAYDYSDLPPPTDNPAYPEDFYRIDAMKALEDDRLDEEAWAARRAALPHPARLQLILREGRLSDWARRSRRRPKKQLPSPPGSPPLPPAQPQQQPTVLTPVAPSAVQPAPVEPASTSLPQHAPQDQPSSLPQATPQPQPTPPTQAPPQLQTSPQGQSALQLQPAPMSSKKRKASDDSLEQATSELSAENPKKRKKLKVDLRKAALRTSAELRTASDSIGKAAPEKSKGKEGIPYKDMTGRPGTSKGPISKDEMRSQGDAPCKGGTPKNESTLSKAGASLSADGEGASPKEDTCIQSIETEATPKKRTTPTVRPLSPMSTRVWHLLHGAVRPLGWHDPSESPPSD
ncbi:uncharacterized protein KY384_002838 [Bacidia gigantensis]|uniref:uncharacterized protein n=1 Tax=Bacidia gigantensis TaxID=2732470 RepID=UPI001D03BC4F|nr:uncharacterized protein KY384_002838 [Bacidia gigantensis]KAG8532353.1 hypothetical protein KY384_002838 [Bacidia gigantensis]